VTAVPVTAISTGKDGSSFVRIVRQSDGKTGVPHRVDVRTGATGGGFVELLGKSASRVHPGDRVVVG
jgi:hypothetical protein